MSPVFRLLKYIKNCKGKRVLKDIKRNLHLEKKHSLNLALGLEAGAWSFTNVHIVRTVGHFMWSIHERDMGRGRKFRPR